MALKRGDAIAQWAADIDAARDRAQEAARDSPEAALERLKAQDGKLRGRPAPSARCWLGPEFP
jgi:hypothetical protein